VVPSIPIAKEEETAYTENDTHDAKTEGNSCFYRDNVVHYNQKNMVQVKKSYLYLPVVMIFMLP